MNAYYEPDTDTYHLALDSVGQAYVYILAHESVHEMFIKNPGGYKELEEVTHGALLSNLMESRGLEFEEATAEIERMVHNIADEYGWYRTKDGKRVYSKRHLEDAWQELVANTVPVILTDKTQARRFADRVMSASESVRAWFEKLLNDLLDILDRAYKALSQNKSWEQMELIRENKADIQAIADKYFEGMEGTKGKSVGTGEVRNSLNPNFSIEYDAWDKRAFRNPFVVGRTSQALKYVGVKDQAILWDASKIVDILHKHPSMTDEVIKQVPDIIENPIIIMESKTETSRITLFGEVFDGAGNPVLAVLELEPTGKEGSALNIIKIASAYGKDSNPQKLLDDSRVLFVEPNQERTRAWLKLSRLQLPLSAKYGINGRISYQISSVNNSLREDEGNDAERGAFSMKDSDGNTLTPEQAEFFKDSKVRDEKGNLLVVYHGVKNPTMEIVDKQVRFFPPFGEFDVSKQIEPGAWFTPDKEYARGYGQPVPFYLNIKNPLKHNDPLEAPPAGHDGIYRTYEPMVIRGKSQGISEAYEFAVFSPSQIKSITNKAPTENPDIRFSLKGMDRQYLDAVERGDMEVAREMVYRYAEQRGYGDGREYTGNHQPPNSHDDNAVSLDRITEIYPDDLLSSNGARYYGDGYAYDWQAVDKIKSAFGKPDKRVRIYRAVPSDVREEYIRNGDWVTLTRAYAEEHGRSQLNGYKVITHSALAKHLYTDGNSVHEFGYDDGRDYTYANTKNNRKSLDVISYDYDGNIIPLSKRFNKREYDVRFSLRDPVDPMYSKLQQVAAGYSGDKIDAAGFIPYLTGRGVKAEEIKWSGLEQWLDGKKSVTKAELAEFLAGNSLNVKDVTRKSDELIMRPTFRGWETIDNSEAKYKEYALKGGSNYREILFTLPGEKQFQSQHWDEPNVLAHTRLQDFAAADGGKVLFVEEVQSDWHEQGRESGYIARGEADAQKKLSDAYNRLKDYIGQHYEQNPTGYVIDTIAGLNDYHDEYQDGRNRFQHDEIGQRIKGEYEAARLAYENHLGGVPDAPFRDTWAQYVMKRILRMAAEGNYNYVAWTTGQMQADRYNLAKVVGSVTWDKQGDGAYYVWVYGPDGKSLNTASNGIPIRYDSIGDVSRMFGKDIARMVQSTDKGNFDMPKDTTIGGEGMRNFYDIGGKSSQNIPRFMDKYVKQWGSKVEEIKLGDKLPSDNEYLTMQRRESVAAPGVRVTDEMKEEVLYKGQPMFSLNGIDPVDTDVLQDWSEFYSEADAILKRDFSGVKIDDAAIKKVAKRILRQYSSTYSEKTLVENLGKIIAYMSSPDVIWKDARDVLVGQMKSVLRDSLQIDQFHEEQYSDVRKFLRETPIYFPEQVMGEIEHGYDSFNYYRKKLFGKVRIVTDKRVGYGLEGIFDDLVRMGLATL